MAWLKGKKTYILAILGALALAAWNIDAMLHDLPETPATVETAWMSDQAWTGLLGYFGFGAAAMLRAGVASARKGN